MSDAIAAWIARGLPRIDAVIALERQVFGRDRAVAALHVLQLVPQAPTLKTTLAIVAASRNRIWTLHDLAKLPDVLDG